MENQRNMILAIVLSALVLFGWTLVADRFFPQPKPVPHVAGAPAAPVTPAAAAEAVLREPAAVIAGTTRVAIDTPKLKGSINLTGAQIDDLVLTTYKDTIKKDSPPVRLLSPSGAKGSSFAGFGWSGDGLSAPNAQTLWTTDGTVLTPEKPVTLSWANGSGQSFALKISVDKDYMFSVVQSVSNAGAAPVNAKPNAFISRFGKSKDVNSPNNHVGPIGAFDNSVMYDVDYEYLDGKEPGFWSKLFGTKGKAGENRFTSTGGWIGFGDHYWLTALVPANNAAIDARFRAGNGNYQAEYALAPSVVQPGKSLTTATHLFVGAKEVKLLDGYEKSLGIVHFGKAIDWGWFEIIAKPFFYLLDWLFKLVGNFGVAIMLLTVIVRGLMFPVAQRQFASMAAMRVVQPKMKAIQERYKDDKPKQQQAIMELYKTEKVNPMSGCLPVFLQIPVFYGLYKVLTVSIEMRHQPFIGWIKDLSAPDPAHILNLFGYLSFEPPAFLGIGILALLLGITMYLQFQLNPTPMDPAQAQMFKIMPWIMMFVLAPFASGLLLYYTCSNLLTIAQQKWLYSRHPVLKAAAT